MTNEERFALLVALGKAIDEELDRANPDGARGIADAALLDAFQRDHTDRRRFYVNGTLVGSLSVRMTQASCEQVAYVEDFDAFWSWFAENGRDIMREFFATSGNRTRFMRYVADHILTTGEVPDGVSTQLEERPASVSTQTSGFKPEVVAAAFGAALPQAIALAIGEGEE